MSTEVASTAQQQTSTIKSNENEKENGETGKTRNGGLAVVGGTRVFKKTSTSGCITCYLGKRDFIDHLSYCDPIDGVVLVNPDLVGSEKVFVHVLAAFRYGREDLDVLGLTFRKDLFLNTQQVYPPLSEHKRAPTKLQERLMKKLGPNAYPFFFELPHSSPASVTLQPAQNDTGKPCGVDYELKAYAANGADERPHKRNAIRLAIRKLIYAPPDAGPQPTAEQVKELTFPHSGVVRLEATLDRQKYYHGEPISINVLVDNNTSKPIKRYKVSIRQYADICLFSTAQYVCPVASLEGEDFIAANQSGWCKVYTLHPVLSANRDKRGLALDGKLKHEETNLASSTIFDNAVSKDNLGIIVSYKVKVKLYLAFGAGDIAVELPFILTHPLPQPAASHSVPASRNVNNNSHTRNHVNSTNNSATRGAENGSSQSAVTAAISAPDSNDDHNLIQLDDDEPDPVAVRFDDDNMFEDFARMRLQAHQARNGQAPHPSQSQPQQSSGNVFSAPATGFTPNSIAAIQQQQALAAAAITATAPIRPQFTDTNPFSGLVASSQAGLPYGNLLTSGASAQSAPTNNGNKSSQQPFGDSSA